MDQNFPYHNSLALSLDENLYVVINTPLTDNVRSQLKELDAQPLTDTYRKYLNKYTNDLLSDNLGVLINYVPVTNQEDNAIYIVDREVVLRSYDVADTFPYLKLGTYNIPQNGSLMTAKSASEVLLHPLTWMGWYAVGPAENEAEKSVVRGLLSSPQTVYSTPVSVGQVQTNSIVDKDKIKTIFQVILKRNDYITIDNTKEQLSSSPSSDYITELFTLAIPRQVDDVSTDLTQKEIQYIEAVKSVVTWLWHDGRFLPTWYQSILIENNKLTIPLLLLNSSLQSAGNNVIYGEKAVQYLNTLLQI